MKELSVRGKSIWTLYLWLHGLFAFLYGVFASYCYLYLGTQVRLASGMRYFPQSLMPLMAGTLLLEAISAPIAGAFADARGRRAAVKRGLHLLALSYSLLAALPLIRLITSGPDSSGFWVLWIGLAGIGLMSVSASFHANALDAWFVDELLDSPASASLLKLGHGKPDLHRFFARQSQVFGACLLLGGVLTLCLGKWLADSARKEDLLFLSPGTGVWVIGALSALLISYRLGDRLTRSRAFAAPDTSPILTRSRAGSAASGSPSNAAATKRKPTPLAFAARLREVLRSPELVRVLLLSSAVYFCGLAVVYFLPLLLRDRAGKALENPTAAWLATHYWVFYIAIGFTRVAGPSLALKFGPRRPSFDNTPMASLNLKGFAFRKRQAWHWGALGFGGVLLAGVAFLATPGRLFLFPLGLILLAKLAIEAFKPVQASYLNELVTRPSRAFALSLATPFGSAALGGLTLLLIGLEGAAPGNLPLEQARLAIPLVFSIFGLITLIILRAVTKPARSAAFGKEDWSTRRKRLREEMRSAGELPPFDLSEENFIRPLGAGDSPEMRPMVLKTGIRTQKPAYLSKLEGKLEGKLDGKSEGKADANGKPPTPELAPNSAAIGASSAGTSPAKQATPPSASTATPPSAPPRAREGRPNLRIVYSRPPRAEGAGE